MGNYQNAEKWLDVALELDQKYAGKYYYLKGFISLRRNDPAVAEKYLLKSVE